MRKSLLAVALAALSLAAPSLTAQAGPPEEAAGLWQYTPFIVDAREAGCNTFLTTYEDGIWTGTFEGNSREDGQAVIHCSGTWGFNAIATFEDVTVHGRTGSLVMSVNGRRTSGTADWYGNWVIVSGTGELDGLRGQGDFWGPGAPGPGEQGDIFYDGKVHFEPN